MERGCIKSGFLQKAGKHTFQAWRKRWFILRNDNIKYFSSAEVDNDSNLLGTIQMVEIQSVKEFNGKKHCFAITTRSRTFYMAAKSDGERDGWVTSIRNISTNQRQVNDASSNIYAEIGCISVNKNNFSNGVYAQVQLDQKSSPSGKNEINPNELSIYETVGKVSEHGVSSEIIPSTQPKQRERLETHLVDENTVGKISEPVVADIFIPSPQPKQRAQSDIFLMDENTTICTTTKIRSLSEGMFHQPAQNFPKGRRVHSLLHDMSVNELEMNDIESICKQIDDIFDGCIPIIEDDDEDDDEDEEVEEEENVPFNLPKPRDGNQIYAFDEINKLAEKSGQIDQEADLAEIARLLSLAFDGNEEHPAIALLSTCLKATS